jgi:DNA polymerase-3 subunit delta'
MDTQTHSIPPMQLWFGHHQELLERAQEFLQRTLCPKNNCGTCLSCQNIRQQQHHAIMWLTPEKNYTLPQLQPIFETISLQLAPDEHFFFVIEHADALTPACANSLLKVMEEPPTGYHFLLLAERQDDILPTIRSRAIVSSFYTQNEPVDEHPLLGHFKGLKSYNPRDFLQDLDRSLISERESVDLVDHLLAYWMRALKDGLQTNNPKATKQAQKMVHLLQDALLTPPMPGSAKLFWKNLFLQMQ